MASEDNTDFVDNIEHNSFVNQLSPSILQL